MIDGPTAVFAFTLGVLTFLSPCGFPMLPAYLAYYLQLQGDAKPGAAAALGRGLRGAAAASAGGLAVFAAIAAGAWFLGNAFKQNVVHFELAGGLLVLGLGVATLAGKGPSLTLNAKAPERGGLLSLAAFGALYAGVAAGCSVPLLLATIVVGIQAGAVVPLLAVYAAGLVGLLALVTVAAGLAMHRFVGSLRRALPYTRWIGGAAMTVVGLYLLYYWWNATQVLPV